MKIKIFSVFILFILIFFLNIFNQIIVSKIYNLKKSTSLSTRENWYGMCNDIVDFQIKNLDIIFIGDSHIYSGINLEIINSKRKNLILICSLPSISFSNNMKLFENLQKQYNPKKIFIGLSPFQFLTADDQKERERQHQFLKLVDRNPYSFQFHSLKKTTQHFLNPISEKTIALKQSKFIQSKDDEFFKSYKDSINYQVNNVLIKRYNNFEMNDKKNLNYIKNFCSKYQKYKNEIVFLDVPTPYFFNENFKFNKNYNDYIEEIGKCFNVLKSKNIKELKKKKYFFDRYYKFSNNNEEFLSSKLYDISHLNYVGAYIYTNFIFNKFKKDIKQDFND